MRSASATQETPHCAHSPVLPPFPPPPTKTIHIDTGLCDGVAVDEEGTLKDAAPHHPDTHHTRTNDENYNTNIHTHTKDAHGSATCSSACSTRQKDERRGDGGDASGVMQLVSHALDGLNHRLCQVCLFMAKQTRYKHKKDQPLTQKRPTPLPGLFMQGKTPLF